MTSSSLKKWEIASLLKARKDLCDEVEKWPMFYKIPWFINKLTQIDTMLYELTGIPYIYSKLNPQDGI